MTYPWPETSGCIVTTSTAPATDSAANRTVSVQISKTPAGGVGPVPPARRTLAKYDQSSKTHDDGISTTLVGRPRETSSAVITSSAGAQ